MSVDRTGTTNTGMAGTILPYAGPTAPTDWVLCDGKNDYVRADNPDLFNAIMPSKGTFTVTIASPGVVTLNDHGLLEGDQVVLATSGSLPTGLTAGTVNYYVKTPTTNTFNLATTRGGSAINTSGTQSGTHTLYFSPYGKGNGATTFSVPDLRGRSAIGSGTGTASGGTAWNLGNAPSSGAGGEETHTLTTAEMAAHNHGGSPAGDSHRHQTGNLVGSTVYGNVNYNAGTGWADNGGSLGNTSFSSTGVSLGNTGGGGAHNIMSSFTVVNYIIRTKP